MTLAAFAVAGAQTPVKNLVVTEKDGNNNYYPASDVENIYFTPAPEYEQMDQVLLTRYEEKGELGLYHIELGMGQPDAEGQPAQIGQAQVALMIAGTWSDNLREPKLPAGYYRLGNGSAPWTFDATQSTVWVRVAEGSDGVTPLMILDGTVDVRTEAGEYDIRMELTTMDGSEYDFIYKGALQFPGGVSDFEAFTEPVNIDFERAQGRFYGNWYYPFAADLTAEFYKGTIENGQLVNGYYLQLDFYEPKPEDPMAPVQTIADGTYTLETRNAIQYVYLPYRFNAGAKVDFMGAEYITKTYITYTSPEGKRKLGLITGGTFTVSDNGSKFVFDFTTKEGVSIKGSYTGKPNLQNYCDNATAEPKRPYSTLTDNHAITWADGTQALTFNEGHSILDDLNTFVFYICRPAMDRGQYIQFYILTDKNEISDGTYPLNWELVNGNMIPGTLGFGGETLFSWYGDLDSTDEEGYQSILACLATGNITITSQADGTKKIVLDLTDDAGKKITGEFTGSITDITPDQAQVSNIKKACERAMRKTAAYKNRRK